VLCGIFFILNIAVLILIKRKLRLVKAPESQRINAFTVGLYHLMLVVALLKLVEMSCIIGWISYKSASSERDVCKVGGPKEKDRLSPACFWYSASSMVVEKLS